MKRFIAIAALIAAAGALAFSQTYDRSAVVKVMQSNGALMGQISAAAGQKDFAKAAGKLVELAYGMATLLPMNPPKGDKAEWDKALGSFLNAAYKGIGAAANQDAAGLQTAIAELRTWNQNGHRLFR